MKGKLTTNLSLTANTSIPKVVHEGGASTWNEITGKPFSRVDTENGLAIYDNTLMIDTLDKIATIDYVDQQIADIPTPTVNIDNKSIVDGLDGLELDVPFGSWSDTILGWKPDFEYNGSALVHALTQDEKNYCTNELIPTLLHGFRLPIITWSFGTYGEYTDYTVTQDGTTVTISFDAYCSLEISADDMTATGYAPIGFDLLIEESGATLEQYNIEVGEIDTPQIIHKIPSEYLEISVNWDDIDNKPSIEAGTGDYSIVEGNDTTASGRSSHAEGYMSQANGNCSHAEGQSMANGAYAHAEGNHTFANADFAHAEGSNTFAWSQGQHVQGKYNIRDDNGFYADIVGNGTGAAEYSSNAEATDWNGNKYLAGDVYTGVTNWGTTPTVGANKLASENYVDTAISNIPDPDWSDIQNKPSFATVATSGDYDDLINKPTIPAATSVTVTQSLSSGTAIGDIDVNGITTTLYAPTPTVIGITNTLSTGTAIADIDVDGVTTTLYAPAGGSSENSLYKTTAVTLASASQSFTIHTTDGIIERSYVTSGNPLGDIFNLYETGDKFDVDYTLNDGTSGTETLYYVNKIGVGAGQYSTSYYSAWVIEDYKDSATIPYNDINQMSNKFLGIFKVSTNGLYVFLAKASSGNYITSVSCGERTLHQVRLTIPVQGGLKATDTVLYAPTIVGQGGIQVSESSGAGYSTYNLSIAPNAGIVPLNLNGNGVRTSFGGGLIAGYPGGFKNISSTLSNNNTTATLSISGVSSGKYIAYIGIVPSTYTSAAWNACMIREIIVDFSNNTIEGAEEYIASYSKSSNVFTLNTRSGWAFTKNISTPGSTGWRAIQADNKYPLDWSNKFESRYIPIDETTLVRNSEGRISSAIPVPPTTDGTYTLQATVSNGTITYSWI